MSYQPTSSGILIQAERKSPQFNSIAEEKDAWVKEYLPGRKKYADPKVLPLNQELASICAGKQKLFAVDHDEHPINNYVGIQIYVTDPDNPEAATRLGNPMTVKCDRDGKTVLRGVPDIQGIMAWLAAINLLSPENRHNAQAKRDWYDKENKVVTDAREAKADERIEWVADLAKQKFTKDTPSRSDRTIAQPKTKSKKKGGDNS